jgi:hypothetical protein
MAEAEQEPFLRADASRLGEIPHAGVSRLTSRVTAYARCKPSTEVAHVGADPAYAEYMRVVKHRFVPGLA